MKKLILYIQERSGKRSRLVESILRIEPSHEASDAQDVLVETGPVEYAADGGWYPYSLLKLLFFVDCMYRINSISCYISIIYMLPTVGDIPINIPCWSYYSLWIACTVLTLFLVILVLLYAADGGWYPYSLLKLLFFVDCMHCINSNISNYISIIHMLPTVGDIPIPCWSYYSLWIACTVLTLIFLII